MKDFVFKVIGIFLAITATIAGFNAVYDTYGIFTSDFSKPRATLNERFVKIRYLIQHPNKYDAYCFGSSRVGYIPLETIQDSYTYYNMTESMSVPSEWLEQLQMMKKHHVQIRRVMLGIDDFSFQINAKEYKQNLDRIPYKEFNLKTYLIYLLRNPHISHQNGAIFDIEHSGRILRDNTVDEKIEKNPTAHRQEVTNTPVNNEDYRRADYVAQTLEDIQSIKNFCDDNEIELIIFINPMEHRTYEAIPKELFDKFLRGLSNITPYYNFSGLNRITTDDYYYYEPSHYRLIVGDMMIHRIFEMPKDADTDFGKYVEQTTD